MSIDLHRKIVQDILDLGGGVRLRSLKLYSEGEPFIDPHIIERIQLSRPIADRIEITSNGSALTEQKARGLLGSGLDYLRISVYGLHPARHAELTGSKITPAQIRANVERFRRLRDDHGLAKPFLYVKMIDTGTAENAEFLETYRPIADEAAIEPPMNWNSYEDRDLLGTMYVDAQLTKIRPLAGEPKAVCPFPFYSLVIKADGDVVACCVDWNKKTKIGSIKLESLGEIWKGEALREFRRMHLERRRHENESCRHCTHLNSLPDNLDHVAEENWSEILG